MGWLLNLIVGGSLKWYRRERGASSGNGVRFATPQSGKCHLPPQRTGCFRSLVFLAPRFFQPVLVGVFWDASCPQHRQHLDGPPGC